MNGKKPNSGKDSSPFIWHSTIRLLETKKRFRLHKMPAAKLEGCARRSILVKVGRNSGRQAALRKSFTESFQMPLSSAPKYQSLPPATKLRSVGSRTSR